MKAPQLKVEKWLNAPEGYALDVEAPRIKIIHVFQMLCPGCVYHGIPQTVELFERVAGPEVDVVGLHSVFEHHDVMTEEALRVFLHEWRLPFPVAIDRRTADARVPDTMKDYDLLGTPSTLVIDRRGELVVKHFGMLETESVIQLAQELLKQEPKSKQA